MNSVEPSHSQGDTFLNHEDIQEDMLHEIYRNATEVSIFLSSFYKLPVCIVLDKIMLSSYISDKVLSCMLSVSFAEISCLFCLNKKEEKRIS